MALSPTLACSQGIADIHSFHANGSMWKNSAVPAAAACTGPSAASFSGRSDGQGWGGKGSALQRAADWSILPALSIPF